MTNWKIQAAKDPGTSPEILESLFDSPECHRYLIKNPSSPISLLVALGVEEACTSDSSLGDMNTRMMVARILSEAPTPEIIDRILTWTEGKLNVIQEGENPEFVSPPEILKHYFYPSAAGNPNTPIKYLELFAKSNYDVTISNLAPNPSLPLRIINKFAEKLIELTPGDEFHGYDRIVENPKLSAKYLTIFSKHPRGHIRAGVARNPNTPEEAQELLAVDSDSYVFFQLQFNDELCESALNLMCQRTRSDVRKSTQWVDDYYRNLMNRVQNGSYSQDLKNLVSSSDWGK